MDNTQHERIDEFVRLLGQHQRRIFLYVLALVQRWNDAEEIAQETNLLLWREFAHFQSGTNFAAWACRVAFHQVLAWRKKKQRDRHRFSPELLEIVARETLDLGDELEAREQALAGCLEKLPTDQRDLVRLRYDEEHEIETISVRLGRTVDAVYRALSRIRFLLHECIGRTLRREGLT